MCKYCDKDSDKCCTYQDNNGDWYIDVETYEWDDYEDDWVHQNVHVKYCPYCGRELNNSDDLTDSMLDLSQYIDYLKSTGLYENESLYYEIDMFKSNNFVPISDLVKRFVEIDKLYEGEPWNIRQILKNIHMITPVTRGEV